MTWVNLLPTINQPRYSFLIASELQPITFDKLRVTDQLLDILKVVLIDNNSDNNTDHPELVEG
jgi:hypothetical protein